MPDGEGRKERVADGVEDGVVRELECRRKGKGRRIEQRLGFGIAVDGRVRQTRGDEHVEGGRHVDINIDGEVEGIANSTLMEHGDRLSTSLGGDNMLARPRTFDRKNRVRCAGSMGTRPDTANGRAFAFTIAAIAVRYAAWLSGSEPRLLDLLGVYGVFPVTLCSTSNSDTLCVRGTGRSGYRLGVGEDMLEIVERGMTVADSEGDLRDGQASRVACGY